MIITTHNDNNIIRSAAYTQFCPVVINVITHGNDILLMDVHHQTNN